jgi:hypothetical protein
MRNISRPYRAQNDFIYIRSQGLALGWYVSPLRGQEVFSLMHNTAYNTIFCAGASGMCGSSSALKGGTKKEEQHITIDK